MCPINSRNYLAYRRSVQEYYRRCAEKVRQGIIVNQEVTPTESSVRGKQTAVAKSDCKKDTKK